MESIGFIGGGNMAEAIIAGVLKKGLYTASRIRVFDIKKERLEFLSSSFGVYAAKTIEDLVSKAPVIIIAVKPNTVSTVLTKYKEVLKDKLLISIAAGVSIDSIQKITGKDSRVIRVMPNTPVLVLEGTSALAVSSQCTQEDAVCARSIFSAIGICVEIEEGLINAVTGLSGSGPAFCFMFIEALSDGGVRAGLPRDIATRLAAATMKGAATMVLEGDKHPGQLKDMVTSPSGTTIEGISVLESKAFRSAVMDAVYAAYKRAQTLAS